MWLFFKENTPWPRDFPGFFYAHCGTEVAPNMEVRRYAVDTSSIVFAVYGDMDFADELQIKTMQSINFKCLIHIGYF